MWWGAPELHQANTSYTTLGFILLHSFYREGICRLHCRVQLNLALPSPADPRLITHHAVNFLLPLKLKLDFCIILRHAQTFDFSTLFILHRWMFWVFVKIQNIFCTQLLQCMFCLCFDFFNDQQSLVLLEAVWTPLSWYHKT